MANLKPTDPERAAAGTSKKRSLNNTSRVPLDPSEALADIKAGVALLASATNADAVEKAEAAIKRTVKRVRAVVDGFAEAVRARAASTSGGALSAPAAHAPGQGDAQEAAAASGASVPQQEEQQQQRRQSGSLVDWERLLALSLHHLASAQKRCGHTKRALRSAEESHTIECAVGVPSPATMVNLVVLYTAVGEFDRAIDMADSAINVMAARANIQPALWSTVFHNKAVAMLHMLVRFGEGSAHAVFEVLQTARRFADEAGAAAGELPERIRQTETIVLSEFGPQQTQSESPRKATSGPGPRSKSDAGAAAACPPQRPSAPGTKALGTSKLTLPAINQKRVLEAVKTHQTVNRRYSRGEPLTNAAAAQLRKYSSDGGTEATAVAQKHSPPSGGKYKSDANGTTRAGGGVCGAPAAAPAPAPPPLAVAPTGSAVRGSGAKTHRGERRETPDGNAATTSILPPGDHGRASSVSPPPPRPRSAPEAPARLADVDESSGRSSRRASVESAGSPPKPQHTELPGDEQGYDDDDFDES